jgi:hypothetical protein
MLFREVTLHRVKYGVLYHISVISIIWLISCPEDHTFMPIFYIYPDTFFNSRLNTTEPMSFSLQDGARAHIEKSSVHFLRSVFGDNSN